MNKQNNQIVELEEQIERAVEDRDVLAWKEGRPELEAELRRRELEMKETRKKKIKHAVKIHRDGRDFFESCLVEKSPVHNNMTKLVNERKGKDNCRSTGEKRGDGSSFKRGDGSSFKTEGSSIQQKVTGVSGANTTHQEVTKGGRTQLSEGGKEGEGRTQQ